MAMLFVILSTLFLSHEVLAQMITQPENLNRNLIEALLESARQEPRYIQDSYIQNITPNIPEYPINIPNPYIPSPAFNIPSPAINIPSSAFNIPSPAINIPSPAINIPSPAINIPGLSSINANPYPPLNPSSDSVCKNLANTIQLMVLSDLLKNREAEEIALRLISPLSNFIAIPRTIRPSYGPDLNAILSSNVPNMASAPRIVVPSSNVMSSVSNGRIERGMLTNMLKYLGGAM